MLTRICVMLGMAWIIGMPMTGQHLDGYSTQQETKDRMQALAMQDIEGIWKFPVNGTVIAIERDDDEASRFRIVAIESPYLIVSPGDLLGYAYPTTKRNAFDARLKEIHADGSAAGINSQNRHRFTLTLNESDALEFAPVRKGYKVSWDWWRLFPYMFRVRVNKVDDRQHGLDGALRLWPRSLTVPPRQPRYL